MSAMDATPRTTAHVVGIVRGREIDAEATLELDAGSVVIVWTRATPWRLALGGIDGIAVSSTSPEQVHLTLYLASGDVLDLAGDDRLRTFGAQLLAQACTIPELTRALRALGSRRGLPGTSHDAWFAPLLSARRSLEGVTDPLRQVAMLDAPQLSQTMATVITQLAVIQAPTDAAAQRAIEAILEEAAEPMFEAIERMAIAADALRGGALDTRLADWRRWMDSVRAVFVATDESWRAITG